MTKTFNLKEIQNLEQRFRTTLINSLGGFKSTALIGTKNKEGQTNLAIFNSFFHVGANPPLIGFIVRPDSVDRHTLSNILETGELTINHVNKDIYKNAHQTSARYPNDISEFDACGLTEEYIPGFYAPFVKESSIKIHATFAQRINIELNGTVMIIAKIKHITLPENCLGEDGYVNLEEVGTITSCGLDSYHSTQLIGRLSYAKPDKETQAITLSA